MKKSKGSCLLSCKGVSQYACMLKFWRFLDSDVGYEDKRKNLIQRIDFAWAVEKDENKKQKKSSKESAAMAGHGGELAAGAPGALRYHRAHQHCHMMCPKPLPNEAMSDLAVNMENAGNAGDMETAETFIDNFVVV
ncbi:hypothetical protein DVH24_004908 [Malus domestica]|uniref:Uncharacterized protein n=1 Tax=Malus domestica TaxID=3750 RepID=A0A498IFR5_MALDO|nr:hypothetical protein DVH24_004908 [Malus domestica]